MRKVVAMTMVALLAAQPFAASAAQPGARPKLDVYASCNVQSEAGFKKEIKYITKRALEAGAERIDFNAVVETQWRLNQMPLVVRKQVELAVAQVKDEHSFVERVKSIVSKEKAKALARDVADRAYQSDKFKSAIEDLAGDVARAVSSQIEFAAADSARPAVKCVRTFLGNKYGNAIAGFVASDTDASFLLDSESGQANVSTGQVILSNKQLIGGAVLLLVRRSIARIARQIGRRVVGAVLSRIASVAAGGVGIALIAYDLFSLRNGVLPIIEKEMTSEDTQGRIQRELASAISEQLTKQLDEVSERSADRVVGIWQEFRNAHTQVVSFAADAPEFKKFLQTVRRADVPKTDRLVALILEKEGKESVMKRLGDGSLGEAIKSFSDAAVQIALETGSIDKAAAWSTLAGDKAAAVHRSGIHRSIDPASLSPGAFKALVALDDPAAIATLAALNPGDRNAMLEIDVSDLRALARQLTAPELTSLASYTKRLEPDVSQLLQKAAKERPSIMRALAPAAVQNGILNSPNQKAALQLMLRTGSPFDVARLPGDVRLAYNGEVSPMLLWHKSPAVIMGSAALLLLVVYMLSRVLFGGRRRRTRRQGTA